MNPETSLFRLTAVRGLKDDPMRIPWSIITLSPVFCSVALVTVLCLRRDLQTITFGIGQTLDLCLNVWVKRYFKHPRPEPSYCINEGYGFPSHHTQYAAFFATYYMLFLHRRVTCSQHARIFCTVVLGCWVVAVGISRCYLTCHTPGQVLGGAKLGCLVGAAWYSVYELLWLPRLPAIASHPICRYLMIRDYSLVGNSVELEYGGLQAHIKGLSVGDKGI
ncbi:unnamed protein product [Chrysoparadoxa australica]